MRSTKKLYLKDGMAFDARQSQQPEGRYIAVYEDGLLVYSVLKGGRHNEHKLIISDDSGLPIYQTMHAVEIYENFEQYYAMLEQIP